MIDPILMRSFGIHKLFDVFGQLLQFLVDLLNPLVGNITVELFLARGRPPQDFFSLVRQQKRQTFNQAGGLVHESNLALKGLEIRELVFNASLGFEQNDRLQTAAHTVMVASRAHEESEAFQPACHDDDGKVQVWRE